MARTENSKVLFAATRWTKTVVVEVVTLKRDAVYGKYLKSRTRYKAHDAKNQYKVGDRVEIMEHNRPPDIARKALDCEPPYRSC